MDQEKHIMLAQGRRCNGGAFFRKNITHFLAAFLMIAFLGILGFMEMQRSYQDQRIVELSERMESRAIVQDETMSKQNQSLSHLKTEVQNLRSELATESRKQAETQEELDQLAYQLNQSLSQLLLDFCSQSGNSTVKLQQSATSDARLQGEIDKLHKSLQTSLSDVKERQDALTKKIDSVKKNGFGNCRSSYDTCNIGSSGNGRYWKDCSTQFFPKEEEVSGLFSSNCNTSTLYCDLILGLSYSGCKMLVQC